MNILVTGGMGYIGSHIIVELLNKGHNVLCIDNLSNSSIEVKERIEKITEKTFCFYNLDIRDKDNLLNFLKDKHIDCCIHLAGYKAVGESVSKPLEYYNNNVYGILVLLEVLKELNCKKIIFSSSATVYGNPIYLPITEEHPKGACTNPYGRSKSMIEQILTDLYISDKTWNITILRYFNPVGAHYSGLIGENPNGIPNNLFPYITQVAIGKLDYLKIFGNDYNTKDGTAIRDFIHVVDLAKGHVCALQTLNKLKIYNLGTGKGHTVLEVVKTFEKVNNIKIPYVFAERRVGDVEICYSSSDKAFKELKWKAKYTLEDMCKDAFKWQLSINALLCNNVDF